MPVNKTTQARVKRMIVMAFIVREGWIQTSPFEIEIIGNRNLVSSFVHVLYDSDGETSVVSKYTISTMVEAYGMHMRVAIE